MAQTICGFAAGNAAAPRSADPGFACRVDTINKIWGFCPTTVLAATDCGLAGYCVDSHDCKNGCGPLPGVAGITTFTCSGASPYCSFLISIENGRSPAASYPYIACADHATSDTIYAVPIVSASTTKSTSTSSSTSASTSAPSTSSISSATPSSIAAIAAATSAPPSSSSEGSNTPIGAIVGGVVGGVAVICLAILAALLLRRRRNKEDTRPRSYEMLAPSGAGDPNYPPKYASKHQPHVTSPERIEVSELSSEPAELNGTQLRGELYGDPTHR